MEVIDRIATPTLFRRPFRRAAVLGAGVMGTQIAAHLANAGLEVELMDLPSDEGSRNDLAETALERAGEQSPSPMFSDATRSRIRPGNFDDHLDRLGNCDWIIEAIVERLDVKRRLLARIAPHMSQGAVVSTNTSGLSVNEIAEGLGENFRTRFLGTHFFNPPRYLKLLELVPGSETAQETVERVAHFADTYLGKGTVIARDTPSFIANRIGTFALMRAMREFLDGRYTMEEIDILTGKLVGRPKSGTFRTADLVGLDTLEQVLAHLHETLAGDEAEMFAVPDLLSALVEEGRTGDKAGAGFYKKEDDEILAIDPESMRYRPRQEVELDDVENLQDEKDLDERLRRLYKSKTRAGEFFRTTTRDVLAYAATVLPEIADGPQDIDRALRWGFDHELGPFQVWDALGLETLLDDMHEHGVKTPDWIDRAAAEGEGSFYKRRAEAVSVWMPGQGYETLPLPHYDLRLGYVRSQPDFTIWENDECALLDIGEQVTLFEFRSKANTLGSAVIDGLMKCLRLVEEGDWRGMVIGNEGANFSAGANLAEFGSAVLKGRMDDVDKALADFQSTMQAIRYAEKPVVAAVHQRALGGGCELAMSAPHAVASAETYIGLVELGIGLIPAGTGSMRTAAAAADAAASDHPSEIQPFLQKAFETIAKSKVSTSAVEGRNFGYLPSDTQIVMNSDRRIYTARETVIRLSNVGYVAPPKRQSIRVLGRPGAAAFEAVLHHYEESRRISEYDHYLAGRLAYVLTGGALTRPEDVTEEYLLELEREVFLSLLGESKTHERVRGLLETGKPVRN